VSRVAALWPTVIAASALATLGVTYAGVGAPLRPLVALWFLAVCPGMALVRLLGLQDLLSEVVLAIAVSLSLETIVALIMIYTGAWSPQRSLDIIVGITLAGAGTQALLKQGGDRR
jgi:hypothetical protein